MAPPSARRKRQMCIRNSSSIGVGQPLVLLDTRIYFLTCQLSACCPSKRQITPLGIFLNGATIMSAGRGAVPTTCRRSSSSLSWKNSARRGQPPDLHLAQGSIFVSPNVLQSLRQGSLLDRV